MNTRKRNIIVGVVVLGGLLALAWMILQFSSRSVSAIFTKSTPFQIEADRADGLGDGSTIQYLGVTVGRVTAVKRIPDTDRVLIDAALNEGEDLPINVTGFIRAQSALGSAATISFELNMDADKKQERPSKQKVTRGYKLYAVNRNSGFLPPEFADVARAALEQKLVQHLDETINKAGDALQSFNKLVSDQQLRGDLAGTLASARTTSENLQKFTTRLDGLATQTEEALKSFRQTSDTSGKRVDEVSKQVGDRMSQLGELLEKVNTIATRIEKGQGTLGLLLNDPRLYESLTDTGKTLSLTVADLRRLIDQWEKEGLTLKLGK
jgi:phospholipid/cholesterol/gamma-HCH transport system substrate-binding protein